MGKHYSYSSKQTSQSGGGSRYDSYDEYDDNTVSPASRYDSYDTHKGIPAYSGHTSNSSDGNQYRVIGSENLYKSDNNDETYIGQ